MPTFFVVLISIYLAGNIYIFRRGAQALVAQPFGVKVLLAVLFWCGALAFIGSFLARNTKLPVVLAHTAHEIGTGWLVFTLYMVLCLIIFDLFRLFNFPCKYGFYISLFLTLSLLSYGYYNYQHPKTEVFNIVINKQTVHNEQPLKVVSVSDVHLGYGTDKEELKQYVEMINAQKPDLILIGGDLIDNSVVPLYEEKMMEELAELKAPLGIYMVPGNHEYISGIRKSMQFINETPIRLLRDDVVTLPGGIQIIGRDDRSNKSRLSLQELVKNIDPANLLSFWIINRTTCRIRKMRASTFSSADIRIVDRYGRSVSLPTICSIKVMVTVSGETATYTFPPDCLSGDRLSG